jgi:hypothetical protein
MNEAPVLSLWVGTIVSTFAVVMGRPSVNCGTTRQVHFRKQLVDLTFGNEASRSSAK